MLLRYLNELRYTSLPRCFVRLEFDSEFLKPSESLSIPDISNHSYRVCSRLDAVWCSSLSSKPRLCSLNCFLSFFGVVESSDELELSFTPSVICGVDEDTFPLGTIPSGVRFLDNSPWSLGWMKANIECPKRSACNTICIFFKVFIDWSLSPVICWRHQCLILW